MMNTKMNEMNVLNIFYAQDDITLRKVEGYPHNARLVIGSRHRCSSLSVKASRSS